MKFFRIILHFILVTITAVGCSRQNKELRTVKAQESINKQVLLAKDYLSNGSKSQAISLLENLENKHPHHLNVIEALGFAHKENGNPSLAAIYFEKLLAHSTISHEYRIFAAQAYMENKAYNEASRHYKEYLDFFPNDRGTWKLLGKTYELDKSYDLAIQAYLNAERLATSDPTEKDLLKLAELYQKVKNPQEAKARCNVALNRNQESIAARVRLLKVEIQLQNWNEVQKHLAKLETMPKEKVDPQFIASTKNILIKRTQKNDASLSNKKIENQKSAQDWHEKFLLSMKNRDFPQAKLAAQEAIKLEPNNIIYTFNYLKVLKAQGLDSLLLEELKKAKILFSNNVDITLALAQTQYKIDGNLQNARSSYEDFLNQAPNHPKSEQVKQLLTSL